MQEYTLTPLFHLINNKRSSLYLSLSLSFSLSLQLVPPPATRSNLQLSPTSNSHQPVPRHKTRSAEERVYDLGDRVVADSRVEASVRLLDTG